MNSLIPLWLNIRLLNRCTMDFYYMSDAEVTKEMGKRIKTMRLNKNWTQQEIADHSGLSLSAIKSVEAGKGTVLSLVKILRALKCLNALDTFLPQPEISPRQLAKLKGSPRLRATGTRKRKD